MTAFYTSDHHFCHKGIIDSCARPFLNVRQMNESMIAAWNSVVRPNDTVYHLGDFGHKFDPDELERIFRRLHGNKHLIIGNHDKTATLRLPWASEPRDRMTISDCDNKIILDHYAMRTWHGKGKGVIHLYGHSHSMLPPLGRSIDVGVDNMGFVPKTIHEIVAMLPPIEAALEDDEEIALAEAPAPYAVVGGF